MLRAGIAATITVLIVALSSARSSDSPIDQLPAELWNVAPATITLLVHERAAGRKSAVKHVVSRTSDRVHLALPDGREWLFTRNALDPRRASGFLVHHGRRAIVVHEESDLRNWLGIRGWVDVLALGEETASPRSDLTVRVVRESVRPGVDGSLLRAPSERFPDYRVLDLAEWLER